MKAAFFPLAVNADKCCICPEDRLIIAAIDIMAEHFNRVLDRSCPLSRPVGLQSQESPLPHAFPEFHLVHSNSDKIAAWVIKTCSNPGHLIHPFQEIAAKKIPVMIQMFG